MKFLDLTLIEGPRREPGRQATDGTQDSDVMGIMQKRLSARDGALDASSETIAASKETSGTESCCVCHGRNSAIALRFWKIDLKSAPSESGRYARRVDRERKLEKPEDPIVVQFGLTSHCRLR